MNRTLLAVIIFSLSCLVVTRANNTLGLFNKLKTFEDCQDLRLLTENHSLAWTLAMERSTAQHYKIHFNWLETVSNQNVQALVAAIEREIQSEDSILKPGVMESLHVFTGSKQKALSLWDRTQAEQTTSHLLTQLIKSRQSFTILMQYIDSISRENSSFDNLCVNPVVQTIQDFLLHAIAADEDLLKEYLRRAMGLQPLQTTWIEVVAHSLNGNGFTFNQALLRAAKWHALPYRLMVDELSHPLAVHVVTSSMKNHMQIDAAMEVNLQHFSWIFWIASRAGEAVAIATRHALDDVESPDRSLIQSLQINDTKWAQALNQSLKKKDSSFAKLIRSAIRRSDYGAIAWVKTVMGNDEVLAKAFGNWLNVHKEFDPSPWSQLVLKTHISNENRRNALNSFRAAFDQFASTQEGWECIANRLWIETNPPFELRKALSKTLAENPTFFLRAWKATTSSIELSQRLNAHLADWIREQGIADDLLIALADLNPHAMRIASKVWLQLMTTPHSPVVVAIEDIIRNKVTGSPVFTLLLSIQKNINQQGSNALLLSEWQSPPFQQQLHNQLWNSGKGYLVADWLQSHLNLKHAWEAALIRLVQAEHNEFKDIIEMEWNKERRNIALKALTAKVVRERLIFESLLTDPSGGLVRKLMEKIVEFDWEGYLS